MFLNKNHQLNYIPFTFLVFICVIKCSEIPRPRGVSLSRAPLYVPEKNFTCFDNTKEIPFNHVNDDYCDCADASDEPGTSACANGVFYCANKGHQAINIPSTLVNDGICDCCDGSDEYKSPVKCINNCLEAGRAARDEAQRIAELIKAGQQLRAEFIRLGIKMKEEKKHKLSELQKTVAHAEKVKSEKETLKKEAEELENKALEYYRKLEEEIKKQKQEKEAEQSRAEGVEAFNKYDTNQDGYIEIAELLVIQSLDKDRNGEVTEEEARFFLTTGDKMDVETFLAHSWSSMKQYLLMDSGIFKPKQETGEDGHDETHEDQNEEHDEAGQDEEEEADEEDLYEEDTPAPNQDEEESGKEELLKYDEETQHIVNLATEARNAYADAERDVRNIVNDIKTIEEYLEHDFGTEDEYATLQGQCFDYRDNEYIYKLCPFDKTSQQPHSGGSETRLGGWSRWNGPEVNKYESMLYDKGTSCWNGPQRFTNVKVSCGEDNKLVSVSEPNRCEYFFEFITPAACKEVVQSIEDQNDPHDEL